MSTTDLLEPFTEANGKAWTELIKALLGEDTSFEARIAFKYEWDTKGMAQFLRAIMTLDALRAQNAELLAALERLWTATAAFTPTGPCRICKSLRHKPSCARETARAAIAQAKGETQP